MPTGKGTAIINRKNTIVKQTILVEYGPSVRDAITSLHNTLQTLPDGCSINSISTVQEYIVNSGIVSPGQQPSVNVRYNCIAIIDMPIAETVDPGAVAEAELNLNIKKLGHSVGYLATLIHELGVSRFAELRVSDEAKQWLVELTGTLMHGQKEMHSCMSELLKEVSELRETLLQVNQNKGGA